MTERKLPNKTKPRFGKISGAAIGSAMAGVDGAAFRTTPPPHEMVEHNRHSGPIVTGDGKLVITLPDERDEEPGKT